MTNDYSLHELCSIFPEIIGKEFDDLCADIKIGGLRNPIVTYCGKILDGRNRYRACIATGVQPRFVEYDSSDIANYVLSQNLSRRHMDAGQRAVIVSSVQDWKAAHPIGAIAKDRFESKSKETGNFTGLSKIADRMALSGASEKTQRNADKLARQSPELAAKVASGEMALSKAITVSAQKKQDSIVALSEKLAGKNPDDFSAEPETDIPEMITIEREKIDELTESLEKTYAENAVFLLAAADGEAGLRNRIAELESINDGLRREISGLIIERNEAIKLVKSYKSRYEKLSRSRGANG